MVSSEIAPIRLAIAASTSASFDAYVAMQQTMVMFATTFQTRLP